MLHENITNNLKEIIQLSDFCIELNETNDWGNSELLQRRSELIKKLEIQELDSMYRMPFFSPEGQEYLDEIQNNLEYYHNENEAEDYRLSEFCLTNLPELDDYFNEEVFHLISRLNCILTSNFIHGINSCHFQQYKEDTELTYHKDMCLSTSVFELSSRENHNDKFFMFPGLEYPSAPKGYLSLFNGNIRHQMKPDLKGKERNILVIWAE